MLSFLTAFSLSLWHMTKIIHHNTCLCCGSAAISKVMECKDYTVSQEIFEVWQCSSCTFRFTQNIPTEEEIGAWYESPDYVSHTDTKQGMINRLYHAVRNHTLKSKRQLVKNLTGLKHGNLLDVGAGTGAFANKMRQAGWQVTGLEPDKKAREKAAELYSLDLQKLQKLHSLEKGSFDAITLWHVLEHVHDLHRYLETFHTLLKSTGRLVIAVPNYTSYDGQHYGREWAAYDVPRHLYHFSPRSMETLLNKKGFSVETLKPMWFDSFYVSMLSEKYRQGRVGYLPAFLTGLRSNVKAMFNKQKCSSIIYVVRKN